MKPRRVALCMACYKGCEPPVLLGLVRMAFALGRETGDQFMPFIAVRKRAELAANDALQQMEDVESNQGLRFSHVLWIDDDVVVDSGDVLRLLDLVDDDHPVVSALAFERQPPYRPAIWRAANVWGASSVLASSYHSLEPIFDYPEDDWVRIMASGLCCVAFDREVFEAIRKPYFDWNQAGYERCDYTPDGYLYNQFHEAFIPCFCHTGVKVGHSTFASIVSEEYARAHGDWYDPKGAEVDIDNAEETAK